VFAKCCVPEFETSLAFLTDTPGRKSLIMKKTDSNRYRERGSVVEKNEVEGGLRNIA
jgi:hypothetical protein